MKVSVLTIGDEILYGHITNTNSVYISDNLSKEGFEIVSQLTVSDGFETIFNALEWLYSFSDIVITTGGLGPTKDDMTKEAICNYFDDQLITDEPSLKNIYNIFEKKNREVNEINKHQAKIPSKSEALFNPIGTSPGIWLEQNGKILVSLPGVPYEMKGLMQNKVIPKLVEKFQLPSVIHSFRITLGIPESILAEKIESWEDALPEEYKLAYLPSRGMVWLRLSTITNEKEKVSKEFENLFNKLPNYIPNEAIISADIPKKEEALLGEILKEKNKSIATAESFTGGYLAHRITLISGSSNYFSGGIVSYSEESKIRDLGVSKNTISENTVVSEKVVLEMAKGVKNKFGTSYGIATSGVAGPNKGSDGKNVGTFCFAIVSDKNEFTTTIQLPEDDRNTIIVRGARIVINKLVEIVMKS